MRVDGDQPEIELQNLMNDGQLETIELTNTSALQPLLDSLGWKIFSERELSKREILAATLGVYTGAVAACFTYNIGGKLGLIIAKSVNANSQGTQAIKIIMSVGTIIPRVALGAIAAQDTFMELATWTKEPVHIPRKNNQTALRFTAKCGSHVLCAVSGLMGAYVHLVYFDANIYLKYLFLPSVFISTDLISQTVFEKKLNWVFDLNSKGAKPQIVLMRAYLKTQLKEVIAALYEMTPENYLRFFREMMQGSNTNAKLQKLFALKPQNPTVALPENWMHKVAGGIGISFAVASSYMGISVISKLMGSWITQGLNIEDKDTEKSIADFITSTTLIPYTTLLATAANNSFKKIVNTLQGRKKPPSPAKLGHAKLRTALSWIAPIFAGMSAGVNAYWPLTEDNIWLKTFAITAIAPAMVYNDALQKLFRRIINLYESHTGMAEGVKAQNLLENIEELNTVIAELPDEQVKAFFELVADHTSSAVQELLTMQYSRHNEKQSFWSQFYPGYQRVTEQDLHHNESGNKSNKINNTK